MLHKQGLQIKEISDITGRELKKDYQDLKLILIIQ